MEHLALPSIFKEYDGVPSMFKLSLSLDYERIYGYFFTFMVFSFL